jgi:transcriptional regulator
MERYPFALITCSDVKGNPVATQIPLLPNADQTKLRGHIMKNTDHHKILLQNPEVLVVFTGPNAYISASWYTKPDVASTWNYMSVHIRGKLNFLNEKDFIEMMRSFTLKFESFDKNSPTYYDNIPEDYRKQHMKAIAGIEIEIENIEATFKLSQDKDDKSYQNILAQLKQESLMEKMLAKEMAKK